MLLQKQDRTDEAVSLLEHTSARFPNHAGVRIQLTEIFLERKQFEKAKKLLDGLQQQRSETQNNISYEQWSRIRDLSNMHAQLVLHEESQE